MTSLYDSPLGVFTLRATDKGLAGLSFHPHGDGGGDPAILAAATRQLDEYFAGERTAFDLPLDLTGTEFQQAVWAQLRQIPYGETTTYGRLATHIAPGTSCAPSAPRSAARRCRSSSRATASSGRTGR